MLDLPGHFVLHIFPFGAHFSGLNPRIFKTFASSADLKTLSIVYVRETVPRRDASGDQLSELSSSCGGTSGNRFQSKERLKFRIGVL